MKHVDILEFASVDMDEYKEVYEFLKKNQEPTYDDNYLNEDLYSVDVLDNLKNEAIVIELPEVVLNFLLDIQKLSGDIVYVRFIKL